MEKASLLGCLMTTKNSNDWNSIDKHFHSEKVEKNPPKIDLVPKAAQKYKKVSQVLWPAVFGVSI